MILLVDKFSSDPIYVQIRNQIVAGIATGQLQAGDKLPGVRTLAADLGVNLHTVNKAYAVLRDEGHITMKGRSGAFVADLSQAPGQVPHRMDHIKLATSLYQLALEHRACGGTWESFMEAARVQVDHAFGGGGPGAPAE